MIQFVAKVPGRFELELHNPDALLAQLWQLDEMKDVSLIPPGFVIA